MKKFMSMLMAVLLCLLIPSEFTYAKTAPENAEHHFHMQSKEKQKAINQKAKENKKIQQQINKKAKRAADLYMALFSGEMHPSEEDSRKVEKMEMELSNISEQLVLIEKAIAKRTENITRLVQSKYYEEALSAYDGILTVMEKQTAILNKENEVLQNYINLLESLRHK
jgi:septal ring factor EnvC (AmiA/AmiB activator)